MQTLRHESTLTVSGKTAIRTILGPQYAKIKKAPKVVDEDEAKVLLSKILPK
jgi:translocation protein SEC62